MDPASSLGPTGVFVGLCTIDIAYVVDAFPAANQKLAAQHQVLTAGGPATNAAVTFSALGGDARLITALGAHPLAAIARADLEKHGVMVIDIARDLQTPPPVSSIFVHAQTGERTVVSANAAAFGDMQYGFDPAWLEGASIVLVDGHHMPLCIAAARAARVPVVLDGGSWKPGIAELLQDVDIAICSADFTPPGEGALRFLRKAGVAFAAITRGADSILWQAGDAQGEIPVAKVRPKDTLGAGDIFHGAFCRAWASGGSFTDGLARAAEVATASTQHFGARAIT